MIGAGIYEAYSNQSAANVTFSFKGVAATYLAIKKSDRGLCMLTVDGESVRVPQAELSIQRLLTTIDTVVVYG